MSTIWKYPLNPGRNEFDMPAGAELLTVQIQNDAPVLWALVWTGEEPERRVVTIYGTGHQMPPQPGKYIATFQMEGGSLVWHAFDVTGLD